MQHASKDDVITPLTSRQRLSEISQHFLSEKDEQPAPWQKTRLIPLLLVCRENDFVAYLLKNALHRSDQTCTVLNIEQQAGTNLLSAATNEKQSAPDICLLPLTSPSAILAIPHNKLLMAVPTSLPGIRLAYEQLAKLAEQKNHITVHIIMLDARDEKQSQRYFSFLCDCAKALLSINIKSLGALYQQAADDAHTGNNHYLGSDDIVKNMLAGAREDSSPAQLPDADMRFPWLAHIS